MPKRTTNKRKAIVIDGRWVKISSSMNREEIVKKVVSEILLPSGGQSGPQFQGAPS